MIVVAGNIQITAKAGKKTLTYDKKAPLPLFESEIIQIIQANLPQATEGTITSDISTFSFTKQNDQITFSKSRGE